MDFQRRDVVFFLTSLERRDVRYQRRDMDLYKSLECHDVDTQRRDVVKSHSLSCRDVALNVATLASVLSVTSRRCPERHDVVQF